MTGEVREPLALAGPLCRYFAWPDGGAAEAATRLEGVERWRRTAFEAVREKVRGGFDWPEDPAVEPRMTVLGRGLDAARLLGIYAQRTELELPDALPERLADDPNWAAGEAAGFDKSHYGHLLVASCWLPADFDFTFEAPRPDGEDTVFGSLAALCDQLHFLDQRTFHTEDAARAAVAAGGIDPGNFVATARVGLARLRLAAEAARHSGQVLALWNGTDRGIGTAG